MNNMLQGNAMQPGSTTTMFGQQPTSMQQGIGSLAALAGMYQMGGRG